jgi:hypothetical protein
MCNKKALQKSQMNIFMKIRILDFHGGDYEECRLLGCNAVWLS